MEGKVERICICSTAGEKMLEVSEAEAIAEAGLKGDRYCAGVGSFSKGIIGRRQVTLMNAIFFDDNDWHYIDSRRNIFTRGVELMWLIGRDFQVGEAHFRGVKYCDPCYRPAKLSGRPTSFADDFFDRGGLIAEIIEGGIIKVGGAVIPPPRGY